jgi:hypothetical protein
MRTQIHLLEPGRNTQIDMKFVRTGFKEAATTILESNLIPVRIYER